MYADLALGQFGKYLSIKRDIRAVVEAQVVAHRVQFPRGAGLFFSTLSELCALIQVARGGTSLLIFLVGKNQKAKTQTTSLQSLCSCTKIKFC